MRLFFSKRPFGNQEYEIKTSGLTLAAQCNRGVSEITPLFKAAFGYEGICK